MKSGSAVSTRPAPGRFSRQARRKGILALAAGVVLLVGAQLFIATPGSLTSSILKLSITLATLAVLGLFMTRSIHWFVGNAPDSALDERERALRDRCYFQAYVIYAGLTVLGAFYLTDLGPDFGLWMPSHPDHWWAVSWAMLILALALPAALVGWNEADPDADI